MSDRATKNGKALSLMIVSLLAIGGLLGVVLMTAPPVQADTCGQASGILSGTWSVSSAQVCSGVMFYLDGDLSITGTGSLTLVNGGITIVEDTAHTHAMSVAAGGSLILINSTITTATNTLNPYVKLAVTVSGNLVMQSGSVLKFPGTIAMNSGAVLNMTASKITGFTDAELSGLGNTAWVDDNDDSAAITMTTATAFLYRSTIDKLYENTQAGGVAKPMILTTGANLYAYDTYLGFDFANSWQVHNTMNLTGTSFAYLFNVTVDEVQSSLTPQYQQIPAFLPLDSGSRVYIIRWMHATATDPYGTTLSAATIWSHIGSSTATWPDNGVATVPSSRTLWYMGKTASNWNTTDSSGNVLIPLWTDTISLSSFPNAFTFSSYEVNSKYTTYVGNGSAAFPPYPSIATSDNNLNVVVGVPVPGLTPDLTVASVTITGGNGASTFQPLDEPVDITASIHDTGQNPVSNAVVLFFSTNVDTNGDGIMDSSVASYAAAGFLIANVTIGSVPAGANNTATAVWTVRGSYETSTQFSVVVNPPLGSPTGPAKIPETDLTNNIDVSQIALFVWPDLTFLGTNDIAFPSEPVVNNNVPVDVTVHNIGTGAATAASVFIMDGATLVSNRVTFNVNPAQAASIEVTWHPTNTGYRNITVVVEAANNSMRNTDYNATNNAIVVTQIVVTQPDLAVLAADYKPMTETQNKPFQVLVTVYNLGQTAVSNTSVAIFLDGNYSNPYGRADNVAVATKTNVTVDVSGVPTPGTSHILNIVVNPDRTLIEGGQGFANNYANVTLTVVPPSGTIVLYNPSAGANFGPTDSVFVQGVVRDQTSQQNGIAGLNVTIAVLDSSNSVVQSISQTTNTAGLFQASLILNNLPDGQYTLRVTSGQGTITPYTETLVVKRNVPFLNSLVPLLGIPWWLFLIIIAAVAAIVIGVTVYFKVYGLGKMVECGECGAFIPEDATVCPKCGVEFEKDMAKCSNCQAWIPVDVKQCPECGVEFATGEVEMADYQEKMRLQYDEVVQKFKEDASRQLGRALSDKEFQEWWRKQPTFLTFEDWLREEEEMRKMGSRPCPVCGTLNSVTATVCHKCGSLMKEQRPPSGGAGSGGMAPPARPRNPPSGGAGGPPSGLPGSDQGGSQAAVGPDAAQRRVIRRPVTPAPVVQKKVIKRPLGEGEQTAEGTDQDQSGDQTQQGDEL